MAPIRVHFGPMPPMLRAIVSDMLEPEPDIQVVGRSTDQEDCLGAARSERAAIIVTQDKEQRGSTCLDLILADPPLGVVAVSSDGHRAAGVSLVRRPIAFDSESPAVLADAIRRIAAELGAAANDRSPAPQRPEQIASGHASHVPGPSRKGGGSR